MNNFNRYWPLLALPVAVIIAAAPYLPGPVRDARVQAQGTAQPTTPQTSTPQTDTAQNAQPQTFDSQTGNGQNGAAQNEFPGSAYNDPNWNPLAGSNGGYVPDASSPYAQRRQRGGTQGGPSQSSPNPSSAATAVLRKVYDASVKGAVRVRVGDSGIGSGFFMSQGGLILTAAHVALGDSGAKLSVVTQAGQELPVTLVGYDEARDLAVLRASGGSFPALKLAASTPRVGAGVVAIGNSRGAFDGGRAGSITALNVSLDPTFPLNMAQSSMPLAPGDSGGPVLNAVGEVVGVSTAVSNQNGQFSSYFVPVTSSSTLVQSLVSGVKRGVPVLGIGVADARQTSGQSGILVTAVTPGLGAARAGLRGAVVREFRDASGNVQQDITGADIIVGVDGKAVSTPAALIAYLRGKQVGDRVTLALKRNGQTLNVPVLLSARPANQG